MSELLASPTAGFAMFGTLAVILGGLYTRHIKLTTRTLIDIALMLALTIVLHQIRIFHMPQGGSVTLGAMVPLLLLSYRYGPGIGALAGFLYGLINIIQDPFIVHPVQFSSTTRCRTWPWASQASGAAISTAARHSRFARASSATSSPASSSSPRTHQRA